MADGHIDWAQEPDLAELGSARAMLRTNPDEALAVLENLAARGSPMSPVYLGWAYGKGDGLELDLVRAEMWLRRGSDSGSALASFHLGMLYKENKKYKEALEEFGRYSDSFAASMYRIGTIYYLGEGLAANKDEAFRHWKRAADMGHVYAERNLALLLMSGRFGIRKIPSGIMMWFTSFINLSRTYIKNPQSYLIR